MFASVSNHFSDGGFDLPWVEAFAGVLPPVVRYVGPLVIVGLAIVGLLIAYKVVFDKGD